MRWLDSNTDSIGMNLNKLWGKVEDKGAWQTAELHGGCRVGHDLGTEPQQNTLQRERSQNYFAI